MLITFVTRIKCGRKGNKKIYGIANPIQNGGPVDGPIMARLGRTPFELANVPDIEIFNPGRNHAYGNYMHQPGRLIPRYTAE